MLLRRRTLLWGALALSFCLIGGLAYGHRQPLRSQGARWMQGLKRFVVVSTTQPKSGWQRLPLHGSCVHAHNRWAWMMKRTFGRASVIKALQQSCLQVQRKHAEFRLAVQDISLPAGGQMFGHLSHQGGRDVDIAYVGRTANGALHPQTPSWATPFSMYQENYNQHGKYRQLKFDEPLNWAFLMALRTNRVRRVEKVLVEPHIRRRLLAYGKRIKAGKNALVWARDHLRYAGSNAADHEDHMHVRFVR